MIHNATASNPKGMACLPALCTRSRAPAARVTRPESVICVRSPRPRLRNVRGSHSPRCDFSRPSQEACGVLRQATPWSREHRSLLFRDAVVSHSSLFDRIVGRHGLSRRRAGGAPLAWHSSSNCTTADGGKRDAEDAAPTDVDADASPLVPRFEPFGSSGAFGAVLAVFLFLAVYLLLLLLCDLLGWRPLIFCRGTFGPRICEELVSGTIYDVEEQCAHHMLPLLGIRTPL